MKKVLIIYPHFPPSNLAGVHRPRLFAHHLPEFGWTPVILTVHERHYEELPDPNLVTLLPPDLRIEKVSAFNVTHPRVVGDIGLRAFFQLYKKAKQLIKVENFDFLYIPVPSFYCALLGRWLHRSTGVQYGIDYIDPWVHHFPGSEKVFSRHWLSSKLAKFLEPIAVKKASLITGVAEGYYKGVLERNPHLRATAVYGGMPYGGEKFDHLALEKLNIEPYLFKKSNKLQLVYAGAMLPNAYAPLEAVCKSISANPALFEDMCFHFIGTGRTGSADSFSIKSLAQKYHLWETVIFEHPQRIPYMDVLAHLFVADGIFILGSTEAHYTPSKIYQGVLSRKPLFALLHRESTGVKVICGSGAGVVLDFDGERYMSGIEEKFSDTFIRYRSFLKNFIPDQVDMQVFDEYSAKNVTRQLADLLNTAITKN